MSYLTEKYHIIFSINSLLNKRTELVNKCSILQILLCFNYFPKAILKDFLVNSVAVNNIFSNLLSSEDRYLKTASETKSNDIKKKVLSKFCLYLSIYIRYLLFFNRFWDNLLSQKSITTAQNEETRKPYQRFQRLLNRIFGCHFEVFRKLVATDKDFHTLIKL